MSESPAVETPNREGPPADPTLLSGRGASEAGIQMAVNTMQKFGRELENLPVEGKKLVEQALSSCSSINHRSTATAISSSSRRSVYQQGIVNAIIDISPVNIPSKAIIETFVLSSVVLTAFSIASFFGCYFLAPFVTMIIPPIGAAIASGLVAPLAVYYQLSKGQYTPLTGFRLLVLAALGQGILVGAALSHLTISSEPFVALSAIASSFAIAITGQTSRISILSITVATSLLIHSTLGVVEGGLTPVYLALTGLYTLAALIPIQLSARDQKHANVNLYTALLVGLSVTSKCLVYGVLGASDLAEESADGAHNQQMEHNAQA